MLKTTDLVVKSGLLDIPAYAAIPDGPGPHPGVVLLTEWAGLNDHMRDVARRMAEEGIACLVHEPFAREAGPAPTDSEGLGGRMVRLRDNDVLADIAAATNALRTQTGVDPGRIGVFGFCMGGRHALLSAARIAGLKAAVCFYGNPGWGGGADEARPKSPIELAAEVACPLLGIYAEEDAFIPLDQVKKLDAALAQAGAQHTIITYSKVGHAFLNDTGPNYNP